ncbi:MAG: hypothetical protein IPL28_15430 [Chloroflexi bacterium]|nr:hypothetical protein [Chloroflexota bacterium]
MPLVYSSHAGHARAGRGVLVGRGIGAAVAWTSPSVLGLSPLLVLSDGSS